MFFPENIGCFMYIVKIGVLEYNCVHLEKQLFFQMDTVIFQNSHFYYIHVYIFFMSAAYIRALLRVKSFFLCLY